MNAHDGFLTCRRHRPQACHRRVELGRVAVGGVSGFALAAAADAGVGAAVGALVLGANPRQCWPSMRKTSMAGSTGVLKPRRWQAYGMRGSQLTAKKRHCQQLGPRGFGLSSAVMASGAGFTAAA